MPKVESDHIHSVDYDGNGVLSVTFNDGSNYSYYGVTDKVYQEFLKADSKSTFFRHHIKSSFHYQKN